MRTPITNENIPHTEAHSPWKFEGSSTDTLALLRAVVIERGANYVYDGQDQYGNKQCNYYAATVVDGQIISNGAEAGCAVGLAIKFLDPSINLATELSPGVVTSNRVLADIKHRGLTFSPEGLALLKVFQSSQDAGDTYAVAYEKTRQAYTLLLGVEPPFHLTLPTK